MPVSSTLKMMRLAQVLCTLTRTWPMSVNLMALPTRLCSIWRRRAASPTTMQGEGSCTSRRRGKPFSAAVTASSDTTSSTTACRSNGAWSIASLPASMREKSSTSLMMPSRCSPERSISARCSRDSFRTPGRGGSFWPTNRARPRMPCSGVRISWLMVARNWSLTALWRCANLSASARSWAMRSVVKRSHSSSVMRRAERSPSSNMMPIMVSNPQPPNTP